MQNATNAAEYIKQSGTLHISIIFFYSELAKGAAD
jgi:hypothetical protein